PGGLSFRDFMEEALYGDGGYYMRPRKKTGTGLDADFATSPTLHPFFGEAVGNQLAKEWESAGHPDPFLVCEFGGGEGDLARNAVSRLQALGVRVQWTHVEISPFHQEKQAAGGAVRSAPRCEEAHVVVAHEFLDALPFRWLKQGKEMVLTPEGWAAREPTTPIPDFARDCPEYALMDAIPNWLDSLPPCTLLVIDYGGRFEALPQSSVVRGYANHEHADPLQSPGEVDITASVDFSYLATLAQERSLETQEAFLIRNGAFEAIAAHPQETLEDMSAFLRLKQLILPTGFGHFRVATYRIQ
ncbi:MAG: SAM-dependent methyltransferase, partial [Thermoplasmatota archaeon]